MGGGVRTPCTLPLDPPLQQSEYKSYDVKVSFARHKHDILLLIEPRRHTPAKIPSVIKRIDLRQEIPGALMLLFTRKPRVG